MSSGEEPWLADRPLDADRVRRTLESGFPDLAVHTVEFLAAGWDYDAYRVRGAAGIATGDGLVIRFPRRAEVADRLDREEETLDFVAGEIGEVVRVPAIELRGEPSPDFPYRYFGHRWIPGVAADHPALMAGEAGPDALARDLGAALSAIHTVPTEVAREAGFVFEDATCSGLYEEVVQIARERAHLEAQVADEVRWLEEGATPPAEYTGPPRFLHDDLCPDHVLVDPATGRLTGLIDWSDASLGDPALDFVAPVLWRGWPFARSVLAHYTPSLDEAFEERLRFLARVLSLEWLDEASRRGGDVVKHLRWIRHAFEE